MVGAPALTALVSGLIQISRPQMWRDELATWTVATRTPGQIWLLLRHRDAVLGPYYLFMHYWIAAFGDSPLAMRLPSTLATAATAGCTAVLGRRISGDKLALTGGMLYALIPAATRFAQEARPYAFMTLAVVLATIALDRAINGAARQWAVYSASLLLIGMFDVVALAIVIGHVAVVVPRSRSAATRSGFALAVAAAGAVLSPLLYLGSSQSHTQLSWLSRPGISALTQLGPKLFDTTIGAGAIVLLAVVGWRVTDTSYPLLSMAILPTLAVWLASQGPTHYFNPRYLLFTAPIWALAAARILIEAGPLRITAALGMFLLLTWHDQSVLRRPPSHEPVIYSDAADEIARDAHPGDAIVYARSNRAVDLGVRFYLTQHRHYPAPVDVWLGRRGATTGQLLDQNATRLPTLLPYPRIWVVVPLNPANPLLGLTPREGATLLHDFHIAQTFNYQNLTLSLLAANPPG